MAGRRGKRHPDYMSNELTVYDFADSARPASSARIKKGAANRGIAEVKKMSSGPGLQNRMMEEEEEELSWFEKDLDDFDIPIPPSTEDDAEEKEEDLVEGTQQLGVRNHRGRSRRSQNRGQKEKQGVVYPVDLWYALANHIHPTTVRLFAAICKDTYNITRKPVFWRSLYRRYYSKDEELPADLKPQAMERTHGLRARCIRALYILEPTLKQRVQPKGHFEADAHSLIGYRCLLVWHQPFQGKWNFCFKLQRPNLRLRAKNLRPAQMEDVRNGYNNVFYNPEEGCCVLQVTTTHFAQTSPHVMGQLLSAVHMTLSINCLHQRLRLSFDSSQLAENSSSSRYALESFFDPAISIRIFHWWDPSYPFPT